MCFEICAKLLFVKRILFLAALAFSLSGCFIIVPDRPSTVVQPQPTTTRPVVVTTNPRPVVSNIIQDFQPTRGNGGSYRVGESIVFRLTVNRPGFVTLVFYNDGSLPDYEIRNIAVDTGLNLIPNSNEVVASEPIGVTRTRAFFTPQPNTNVSFLRGSGVSFFEDTSNAFLSPYPVELRDVKDTFVVVTR
jgi:hypothetical protein